MSRSGGWRTSRRRRPAGVSPVRMPTVVSARAADAFGRQRDALQAAPAGSSRRRPRAPARARCRGGGCRACGLRGRRHRPVVSRSMPQRNAARVLPEPVGARISVWSPAAMAGQPWSCAAVGAANEVVNHCRTGSEKSSRATRPSRYRRPVTPTPGELRTPGSRWCRRRWPAPRRTRPPSCARSCRWLQR